VRTTCQASLGTLRAAVDESRLHTSIEGALGTSHDEPSVHWQCIGGALIVAEGSRCGRN
jgi:hypothetical protein